MNNLEVYRLHVVLESLRAQAGPMPTKFALAVAYNARLVAPMVEAMRESMKGPWDDVLAAFEQDRQNLLQNYAERNEDGSLAIRDGAYKISDTAGWEAAFADLLTRHEGIPEANRQKAERTAEIEREEAPEITLRKVSEASFPDSLTVEHADYLLPMLSD